MRCHDEPKPAQLVHTQHPLRRNPTRLRMRVWSRRPSGWAGSPQAATRWNATITPAARHLRRARSAAFRLELAGDGPQLFAADDLEDFELLAQHLAIFGDAGRGNYSIDDGSTLRHCTMADLLKWLAQQVDLRRYAEAVAVAAEELKRTTPVWDSQDRAQWRAFRAAEGRWRIARGQFDYALDIVELYGNYH